MAAYQVPALEVGIVVSLSWGKRHRVFSLMGTSSLIHLELFTKPRISSNLQPFFSDGDVG